MVSAKQLNRFYLHHCGQIISPNRKAFSVLADQNSGWGNLFLFAMDKAEQVVRATARLLTTERTFSDATQNFNPFSKDKQTGAASRAVNLS